MSAPSPDPGPDGAVRLRLEAPASARAGRPISFVLRLRNPGTEAVTVYLTGTEQTFDVVVTRDGREVWSRLRGASVPMVLRMVELAPGGEMEWRTRWDGRTNQREPAPPGEYRARGVLLTDTGRMESPEVEIRLTG